MAVMVLQAFHGGECEPMTCGTSTTRMLTKYGGGSANFSKHTFYKNKIKYVYYLCF